MLQTETNIIEEAKYGYWIICFYPNMAQIWHKPWSVARGQHRNPTNETKPKTQERSLSKVQLFPKSGQEVFRPSHDRGHLTCPHFPLTHLWAHSVLLRWRYLVLDERELLIYSSSNRRWGEVAHAWCLRSLKTASIWLEPGSSPPSFGWPFSLRGMCALPHNLLLCIYCYIANLHCSIPWVSEV